MRVVRGGARQLGQTRALNRVAPEQTARGGSGSRPRREAFGKAAAGRADAAGDTVDQRCGDSAAARGRRATERTARGRSDQGADTRYNGPGLGQRGALTADGVGWWVAAYHPSRPAPGSGLLAAGRRRRVIVRAATACPC